MNTQAFSWMHGRAGRRAVAALGAGALALGAFAPAAAQAAAPKTLYVSQTGSDSSPCTKASPCATVSHALTIAASRATIKVSGTIEDNLTIAHPVTVTTWPHGPARSPGALDGTASGTVVTVGTGVAGITLKDLTIEDGITGINNNGTLTLTDSTVSGNTSNCGGCGGGINNGGTMTVIDSTVTKNTAPAQGGGISNGGTMTVIASTISGNTADEIGGGGIFNNFGVATLGATIVADNTGGNCYAENGGRIDSATYNLTNDKTGTACGFTAATDRVNKNPLLGHLASNGGPTKTLLPGAGGPADDAIPQGTSLHGVTVCPGTDQRGVTRPAQGETRCTIGAVEV